MIIKSGTDAPYTQIANQAINDIRLSDKALATLTYLMSRPNGWRVYAAQIARRFGCTRQSAQKYLDELIAAGYAKRKEQPRKDGKSSYDYDVADNPDNINSVKKTNTNNITSLSINAQVKQCIDELRQYMSMYRLIPSGPLQSIKPQIRQIVAAGITPKIFALFALDWMHGSKGTVNIKEFAADAVETLTYNSVPEATRKYDDCIVNYDMEVD